MTRSRRDVPERILTLHPEGKEGVNITRPHYDAMRAALLEVLEGRPEGVPFQELRVEVLPLLPEDLYPGGRSATWYLTTVKLDLEARGEVRRLPGRGPQRLVRGD